jgi:hypothetical protein
MAVSPVLLGGVSVPGRVGPARRVLKGRPANELAMGFAWKNPKQHQGSRTYAKSTTFHTHHGICLEKVPDPSCTILKFQRKTDNGDTVKGTFFWHVDSWNHRSLLVWVWYLQFGYDILQKPMWGKTCVVGV